MSKGIRSHRDKRSSQRRRTTIAQNDLSTNEALHELSEKRISQRESTLQQISALGDAEKLMSGDMATANERMEELKNQFAELSTQAKKELRGTTLDQQLNTLRDRATEFESESKSWILREGKETLAEFFEASSEGDDNQKRLATLYSGLIDFYGREEAATLMEQWVSEHRNYFDFQIHRPKEQPGTDNDNLAPSMQSIDNVALAIKAFILSRIAYRMKSGGDHQTINIRVTMDDGIERKNRTSYE